MSVEGDLFRVTVKGSRESMVRMMNAALKSFNSESIIAESDDAKTMNSKLEMFTGKEGKDIGIPDLLGQGNDEDIYRNLELVRIEDAAPGLIAKFSYYLSEAAYYYEEDDDKVDESVDWDTVALHYNCQVFLDDDWYINGQFLRFGEATIYDASDGEIRKIYLSSGSKYDAEEYPFFLKTLAHLYPDHYGVDWEHYHSKHPEVEISEDECLAWFNEQKQPWDQEVYSETEEVEPGSMSHLIDENGHAVIPEGTIRVDYYAFYQCEKLVSVSIPDTVAIIEEGAFAHCENLTSITLPSSLGFIEEGAFFGCKGLRSIVIPNGVKMIDARAFAECTSLTEVHLPAGVAIDSSAFNGSPSYMYFEFGTVKQMINAVGEAISYGSLLHFSGEPDNTTQIYHTKKFKEKIVLRYRKNKIFYTVFAHKTIYESWAIHLEKVLENFIKLYESTK
jgi:hypothetical protein